MLATLSAFAVPPPSQSQVAKVSSSTEWEKGARISYNVTRIVDYENKVVCYLAYPEAPGGMISLNASSGNGTLPTPTMQCIPMKD